MTIDSKILEMLRLEAEKLLERLEKIPDSENHFLEGPVGPSIADLIQNLREFTPTGQRFLIEYTRSGGKFRFQIIEPRLRKIEALCGLSSPQVDNEHQVRVRR